MPAKDLPRALSIVYAGVSVATILSLPLASYLGHLLGWRNVFLLTSLLGGVMYAWQFAVIPPLPSRPGNSFSNMFALLRRNWVLAGMGGTIFSYGGYHVFFTYLRPFLEHDLALQPAALSSVLLAFGIANCLGTLAAGFVLGKWFRPILFGVHLALAAVAILLFYVQNRR